MRHAYFPVHRINDYYSTELNNTHLNHCAIRMRVALPHSKCAHRHTENQTSCARVYRSVQPALIYYKTCVGSVNQRHHGQTQILRFMYAKYRHMVSCSSRDSVCTEDPILPSGIANEGARVPCHGNQASTRCRRYKQQARCHLRGRSSRFGRCCQRGADTIRFCALLLHKLLSALIRSAMMALPQAHKVEPRPRRLDMIRPTRHALADPDNVRQPARLHQASQYNPSWRSCKETFSDLRKNPAAEKKSGFLRRFCITTVDRHQLTDQVPRSLPETTFAAGETVAEDAASLCAVFCRNGSSRSGGQLPSTHASAKFVKPALAPAQISSPRWPQRPQPGPD